jgi:tRNA(Ile)-lysidine synthase
LLVAVSGGADSTALLLGLARVAPEFGLTLHAAHLHHGLRGADADADLEFVRGVCGRLQVPLAAARWDTRARLRRRGLSGQAGLRVLRHEFLARWAMRVGAVAIATAHTADDQLETLLMRLMRGSGLRGLGGIRPRHRGRIRPLLEATRADIEADLRKAGQGWREDASNRDLRYARNRVRNSVVTAMAAAADTDRVGEARARLARRAAEATRELRSAHGALRVWATRVYRGIARIQGDAVALDSRKLGTYPYAVRRLILQRSWTRLAPDGVGLTDRHYRSLDRLLCGRRGGARVDLPGVVAEYRHGWMTFARVPSPPRRSRSRPSRGPRAR